MICKEHKVKWCVGSNLFSSWRHETEQEQRQIYDDLGVGLYKEVEPHYSAEQERIDELTEPIRKAMVGLSKEETPEFLRKVAETVMEMDGGPGLAALGKRAASDDPAIQNGEGMPF
jgi:hypothetical protein